MKLAKALLAIMGLLLMTACSHDTVLKSHDVSENLPTPRSNISPRIAYGEEKLEAALTDNGLGTSISIAPDTDGQIVVGTLDQAEMKSLLPGDLKAPGAEGFELVSLPDGKTLVAGADDSGALYGEMELADRINATKNLPVDLNFIDAPQFRLRGTCIAMQKTYLLPGRKVYEYPYTPELFPFFYDKDFWNGYLDFLAENRMNTVYLWNGHPFASLVKLKDYPEAVEVSPEILAKNQAMYHWIMDAADKRGIRIVQSFYSIIISKPFAEAHGLSTQLAAPNPLVSDYTRKSIAEFVREYPQALLMPCLGEALKGTDNQQYWATQVILPGILDGLSESGRTDRPPVIFRSQAADLPTILPAMLKIYPNLCSEYKYNGESLTTWEPRGKEQEKQLKLASLATTHVVNVHVLANLEPFRYGDQRFIKKCVIAIRDRLGGRGLHLYPLAYWSWPYSPDKTDPPLLQYKRDWIWFDAWARYSWNPDIPDDVDHAFWIGKLSAMYGANAAENILAAYNDSGECAPRIIRRFGITEGNRQTMSLGMTLDQLVNPDKYGAIAELWESQAPPGERLQEYADKEWNHQPHEGETPVSIIAEVQDYSKKAVDEIDAAEMYVTTNKDDYEQLRNDIHCIREMSLNYCDKANAALCVLRYNHSKDIKDLLAAQAYLDSSLQHFKNLTEMTKSTYQFANTMQTRQRKIPVVGGTIDNKPDNYHWWQLLPVYVAEDADFHAHVAALQNGGGHVAAGDVQALPAAKFTVITPGVQTYTVEKGSMPFSDRKWAITAVAPELKGLTGIAFAQNDMKKGHYVPITIQNDEPVQVLIGYFQDPGKAWLQLPTLETDAAAGEHLDTEPILENAVVIPGCPAVNVHILHYEPGKNVIEVYGKGSFVILGVVPQSAKISHRDAGLKPAQ